MRDGELAQDDHLEFHTAPELCANTGSRSMLLYVRTAPEFCESKFKFNQGCFTSTDTVIIKDYQGLVAQDGHLGFHTAPELCGYSSSSNSMLLSRPQRP